MNRNLLQAVVRHAGSLAAEPEAGVSDDLLLRKFIDHKDPDAFAELLRRHGPMVWAVCRQLLANPADAEDAFQATFLALVRSAQRVRNRAAVGAWLHGVAVRAATKLKRSAVRRRQREARVAGPEFSTPVPDSSWDDLLAAVHEEIQRLPDGDRVAFVLCDLEGVRQPDAAARLGWKPGTLTGRLARARKALLERLTRRGVAPAAAAGSLGLGAATAGAVVPAQLTDRILTAIGTGASDVSPAILQLALEVTPMTVNRTKLLAAAVLLAGGLAAAVGVAGLPSADAQPPGTGDPSRLPPMLPGGPGPGELPPGSPDSGGGPGMAPGLPGAPPAGAGRTQWEYHFEPAPSHMQDLRKLVVKLGSEGWEFAGEVETGAGLGQRGKELVFKRPRASRGGGGLPGGPGGPGGLGPMGPGGKSGGSFPGGPGAARRDTPLRPADDRIPPGNLPTSPEVGGMGSGIPGGPGGSPMGPGGVGWPGAGSTIKVVTLKHAPVERMAATLQQVFSVESAHIVADDHTNSLIVRADGATHEAITALIQKLDVPADSGSVRPPKK